MNFVRGGRNNALILRLSSLSRAISTKYAFLPLKFSNCIISNHFLQKQPLRKCTGAMPSTSLSYEEMKALVNAHDILLIDVRDPDEIAHQGSLPGSYNIPLGKLPEALQMNDDDFYTTFKFNKPRKYEPNVVFYALSHIKSTAAIQIAHKYGYVKARQYPGGWEEWKAKL